MLDENCTRIENNELQISDLLCCDYGRGVQHVAFITQIEPYLKVLHAKRMRGVIEHRLTSSMEDYRAWARSYRIRGVK